jgi:hypothetical protein
LREIQLVVKVLPTIHEKIVFVGFIQRCEKFEEMEQVKTEYERYTREYIITD